MSLTRNPSYAIIRQLDLFAAKPEPSPTPAASASKLAKRGKTRSTDEAMRVLEDARAELIATARDEAAALARAHGTVHSRMVRAALEAKGLVHPDEKEFWIGAVFRDPRFEWTGERYSYSDAARNVHERTIKVWRLKGGAK